jgi:hypothetical protein
MGNCECCALSLYHNFWRIVRVVVVAKGFSQRRFHKQSSIEMQLLLWKVLPPSEWFVKHATTTSPVSAAARCAQRWNVFAFLCEIMRYLGVRKTTAPRLTTTKICAIMTNDEVSVGEITRCGWTGPYSLVARILDQYWSMLVQSWTNIIIVVQYYTNIGQIFFATRG